MIILRMLFVYIFEKSGTSLVVQWLRLHTPNAGDPGSTPGQGTKIPQSQFLGFPGSSAGEESACNVGDLDSIPGLGRSPGGGNDKSLQYSCLENPMDRGAWQAPVHRVAKSWTQQAT